MSFFLLSCCLTRENPNASTHQIEKLLELSQSKKSSICSLPLIPVSPLFSLRQRHARDDGLCSSLFLPLGLYILLKLKSAFLLGKPPSDTVTGHRIKCFQDFFAISWVKNFFKMPFCFNSVKTADVIINLSIDVQSLPVVSKDNWTLPMV